MIKKKINGRYLKEIGICCINDNHSHEDTKAQRTEKEFLNGEH